MFIVVLVAEEVKYRVAWNFRGFSNDPRKLDPVKINSCKKKSAKIYSIYLDLILKTINKTTVHPLVVI